MQEKSKKYIAFSIIFIYSIFMNKITLTKKELESLYYNNPNSFLREKLGITNPTLIKLLRENGIEKKGKGKWKEGRKKIVIKK